ncbi:MAG: nickel pincer cofactor biosynthesis protein LarB [Anaerolineales bacterium]|nr:nickel pincer cofactor biosynthesis protein LarB [Anaerolineales bacterium]
MDSERIRRLLEQVRGGELAVEDAFSKLKDLPYEDMGFARVDTHRAMRKGYPEVIFCPGKTIGQIEMIFERLAKHEGRVMAARATAEAADAIKKKFPQAVYHESARIVTLGSPASSGKGTVLVMSAGTADIPVADEAAVTAETLGSKVERLFDVGVAGIHRLLDRRETLFAANVLVVVAGMDGALPSVVGGLVSRPVIAVPTSIGYGASFGGLAALLTMLNSCAPGVTVVNIDNGFGAGYMAHMVNQ